MRCCGSRPRSSLNPSIPSRVASFRERRSLSLPIERVTDFRNITGQGALARMGERGDRCGRPGLSRPARHTRRPETGRRLAAQSKTVVYLLRNGQPLGAIALADVVRPESREAVAKLKAMGIKCMMLTGDNRAVAKAVADELGLDDYFAEVLPADKAKKIREVKSRGLTVAMVGDGVNDAPALVESDLGIAIGAGTNVAIESADVVLVRSNPLDVVAILGLSRATYRKMVQNLWWATGYNAVAIPLAAGLTAGLGFFLSPAVGAVFMAASTVIVAINAKLLERAGSHSQPLEGDKSCGAITAIGCGSMGGFMGLGWIVILIVIVAVVWLLMRGPLAGGPQTERRSALDILKERYARGEIGREEFEEKKRDLEA